MTHKATWASLVAQMVKHLSAMQETWVQSPGQEDPLEKETATHSSILFFFFQYSCLENSTDRGAQQATVPWDHRVGHHCAIFTFTFHVGSSQTRDQPSVPCIARCILNHWTTSEAPLLCF